MTHQWWFETIDHSCHWRQTLCDASIWERKIFILPHKLILLFTVTLTNSVTLCFSVSHRICCRCQAIPLKERPITTLKTLPTSACSHRFLSNRRLECLLVLFWFRLQYLHLSRDAAETHLWIHTRSLVHTQYKNKYIPVLILIIWSWCDD